MIVNDQYKFIFVHIPKTAGTSLRFALGNISGNNANISAKTNHETPSEFFKRTKELDRKSVHIYENYKWICFVRNPWNRFCSLHRYLLAKHRKKYPCVPEGLNEFAAMLHNPPEWFGSIRSLRPQTDYVPPAHFDIFIGRFETLDEDCDYIADKLAIEIDLGHMNATASNDEILSAENVGLIGEKYASDVQTFGYSAPS